MRFPRVKAEGRSFYHCISRVVDGRFIFGSCAGSFEATEFFRSLMRRLEGFSGIRVLTYALMANHFHLLCEVPEPRLLSQSEVLERIEAGYGPQRVQAVQEQLARYAQQPDATEQINRLLDSYRRRMNDISIFIKELKGRFAQWYNRRFRRYGALWAERFKSLLLEGGQAVATVAAYIDLNPVRAALCADPKDYRYCGYAEAIATGSSLAHEGIRSILDLPESTCSTELDREYRKHLYLKGAAATEKNPPAESLAGNGAEELAMAQRYLHGANGEPRNSAEAAKWLWKAMGKHNGSASVLLADLYLKGDGVPKNCDQARILLDSAALRGTKDAGERLRHLQAFGCN